MQRITGITSRVLGIVLLAGLASHGKLAAQTAPDAEFKKVADAFAAAWAKGDAKALTALHSKDAVRLSGNGDPAVKGAAAIEQAMAAVLSGPYKGTTLTITPNGFTRVTPDIYVGEGTYQVSGGTPPAGTPLSGQYMNTMVRQDGKWLIAAAAVMPSMK